MLSKDVADEYVYKVMKLKQKKKMWDPIMKCCKTSSKNRERKETNRKCQAFNIE